MYATLLLVSLAAAFALSAPSIPQECMDEIQEKYAHHLTLSRVDAHDHTAIMKKVMEQIDISKCINVQFRIVMSTEKPNNENVSYKQHGEEWFKNIRDELKEDDDVFIFKVKGGEEDQADRHTQNHHNFHYDRKDRHFEKPQQSYIATDNINQYNDEEKFDNIDGENTSNDEIVNHKNVRQTYGRQNANYRNGKQPYYYNSRQIDDTHSEYNTRDLKYNHGKYNNYNTMRSYDTQTESNDNNYYNTRRPYDTRSESNDNNYYNTGRPYDTRSESNYNNYYNTGRPYDSQAESNDNNYYNTGRSYDTQTESSDNNYYSTGRPYDIQSESTGNYYNSRSSNVPYDSTNMNNHNLRKTDVTQKSTQKFVNQDDSSGYHDSSKKEADETLKNEAEKTNAPNDEVTNKYDNVGNYADSTIMYHDTSTVKNDYSNNNDTSKTDVKTKQATSRYVNQNEENNNNFSERPMGKDFHTFDDGKSSQTVSNNNEDEKVDLYEKQAEKNIDIGVENKENIDYFARSEEFYSGYTEGHPDERLKKLNSQNNHEWQIVHYTTTEMINPVTNSTAAQKTNTEIIFGQDNDKDNKESDTIVNKQNLDDDKTKDTSENSGELEKKDVNNNDDKFDTSTVYQVRENPESSSTISNNEYNTPSESKQEVQTETTNHDHSEDNYVVSDTGHTDMLPFDGSEKRGMDSETKNQNNDQTENNAVPIQDNYNAQKGNQNSVPEVAFSSQWLNGDPNTKANLVNKNEIIGDQYQTENCYLKVFNNVFNTMSKLICSFYRLIRSFF